MENSQSMETSDLSELPIQSGLSDVSDSQVTATTVDKNTIDTQIKEELLAHENSILAELSDVPIATLNHDKSIAPIDSIKNLPESAPELYVGGMIIPASSGVGGEVSGAYFYISLDAMLATAESNKLKDCYAFFHHNETFVGTQSTMYGHGTKDSTHTVLYAYSDVNNQMYLAFTRNSLSSSNADILIEDVLLSRILTNVGVTFGPLAFTDLDEFEKLMQIACQFALIGVSRSGIRYIITSS